MTTHGRETEKKFLVRGTRWRGEGTAARMMQGYISTDPDKTIRIRVKGDDAILTLKGRAEGDSRVEEECGLADVERARSILEAFGEGHAIEKTRHVIDVSGFRWELDEFHGANAGLVVVELEAPADDDANAAAAFFAEATNDANRPAWLGIEVTADFRYTNARLAERPFASWTPEERADMEAARTAP